MRSILEVSNHALRWSCSSGFWWRFLALQAEYELRAGDHVIMAIKRPRKSGSLVVVESADGTWSLTGFAYPPKAIVRVPGSEAEVAVYDGHSRGENVRFADGRAYRWVIAWEGRRPIRRITDRWGQPLIHFNGDEVNIEERPAAASDLALLTALGWYIWQECTPEPGGIVG